MKADASGWLSGIAGNPSSGATGANGSRASGAETPAPAFDRLLRRTSSSTRSERTAATETREREAAPARDRAKPVSSDTSGTRPRAARDARADAARRAEPSAGNASVAEAHAEPEPQEDTGDGTVPAAWPPAGLALPVMPPLADGVPGQSAVPAADTPNGASGLSLTLPAGLRMAGSGVQPTGFALAGDRDIGDIAMPADAAAPGTLSSGETAVATGRASGQATGPALPATATPAPLALTGLALTDEPLPPVLAADLAALKDMAGDAGNDTDPTPPVPGALLGAPAPVSDHGLARTATVNPLTTMTPDLRGDRFGDTLGTQMTWMAEQKIGHAHIRVSPGDLGAIEVSLRLDGDRVHADFSSAQPEVRQALQDSLPKLREMLGQQGFQLAQADVGHRQQSSSQSSTPSQSSAGGRGDGSAVESGQGVVTTTVRTLRGLLDAYA